MGWVFIVVGIYVWRQKWKGNIASYFVIQLW
jgi:hypothetical protein